MILLMVFTIKAQHHDFSSIHSGYLITYSDSLSGSVSIDLESNTILFKSSTGLQNYSAKQIKKVVYFDEIGVYRTIISGYWGSHQEAFLFEELVGGTNPLLFRSGMKFDQFDENHFPPYFTKKAESIYSLGNKKDIFRLFQDESDISDFARKNKLKVKIKEDLILLFSHANGAKPMNTSAIAIDEI